MKKIKKKLGSTNFIETPPSFNLDGDELQKSFILKIDMISFDCSTSIKFEDIRDQLVSLAKQYIDDAQLLTSAEYDQLTFERYKNYKLPLAD